MHLPHRLLLTACVVAPLAAVEPVRPVINEIIIEGTVRTHPDRIRMMLNLRAGDRYDQGVLAEDLKAIHAMQAFSDVRSVVRQAGDGGVDLIIRVVELPYVGQVNLVGVGFWDEVDKLITTRRGSYLDEHALERDRQALERYFRNENFLHAEVTVTQTVDEVSGIRTVTFTVDRGHEVTVDRTIYTGLPDDVVELFVDGRLTNRPGAAFSPDLVTWDARAVETYLHDLGYLEAVVDLPRVEFFDSVEAWEERHWHGPRIIPDGRKNNRVVMTYTMAAGPRYRLGDVRFVGNSVATEEELRRAFALPEGAWFEADVIREAEKAAMRVIRNQGYARAGFTDEPPRYDHEAKRVHLTLQIHEGIRYRIGRVDPVGNTKTKAQIVYRDMAIGPGDLWNDDAVDESLRQLQRIGLFKIGPPRPLRIIPVYPPERPDEVDLRVLVDEEDTAVFNAMAGWSSSAGMSAEVSFTERNFDTFAFLQGTFMDEGFDGIRGGGHQLNTFARLSRHAKSFGVTWTNPRLYDGPYSLSLGFTRSDASDIDWTESRQVSSATVGRFFLRNDLALSLGYAYTDLDITRVDQDAADQTLIQAPGNFHLNTVTLNQSFDRRDSRFRPTSGFQFSATESVTGGVLTTSHENYSLSLDMDAYIPLIEADLGGVTHIHLGQRWGYLGTFSSSDPVPFYTRFYGGGPFHHRGYARYDLGPTESNVFGYTARPGGTSEWLTTAELFVPIQGTRNGFHMVGFTDIGQVWGDNRSFRHLGNTMPIDDYYQLRTLFTTLGQNKAFANFAATGQFEQHPDAVNLGDLKVAVGIGVRFPVFLPVSIDLAWLLNGDPGDDATQFHFTMRKSF